MVVGLLGLQGAFRDHIPHLIQLGAAYEIIRDRQALKHIDRLILPGGESTVMAKFLLEAAMDAPLRRFIASGKPVWGICAGAILLARQIDGRPGLLKALPVSLTRNAYGRQAASDIKSIAIPILNRSTYPAYFIRAPKIILTDDRVRVHSVLDTDPVFIQYNNIMATTFHPELNSDDLFHDFFLNHFSAG